MGQYEDGVEDNSTWETGDWNADLDFNSADFVTAFQDGGYEQGLRDAVQSCPRTGQSAVRTRGSAAVDPIRRG